jgi:hypothetical protein
MEQEAAPLLMQRAFIRTCIINHLCHRDRRVFSNVQSLQF